MRAVVVLCLLGLVCACGASEEPVDTSDAAVGGGGAGGGDQGGADAGSAGGTGSAGGGSADAGAQDAGGGGAQLEKFSFFVTSLASLRKLSKSQNGFGGDLRYGETGDGAGLRGADKICAELAELSMPGASAKQWRAFLSTSKVNAKDRIGSGPWYDRTGRVVAQNLTGLLKERPEGDSMITDDLPNEFGVPNHDPDGTGQVDNHDMLTGTNTEGTLYCPSNPANCTCNDWTSAAKDNTKKPRVGHSWPRRAGGGGGFFGGGGGFGGMGSFNNWISALDEAGCGAGINLLEVDASGNPAPNSNNPVVGSGGGYGGFYCFALTP